MTLRTGRSFHFPIGSPYGFQGFLHVFHPHMSGQQIWPKRQSRFELQKGLVGFRLRQGTLALGIGGQAPEIMRRNNTEPFTA